mmetsp:Transcript_52864/g.59998  ORF Transcript_52864/g.59998 Transcript_52864/m.59998 type:complete len:670 (+) Transcript_52864:139-2148(+)
MNMKISLLAFCVISTVSHSNVGVVSAAWGWGSSSSSASESTTQTEEVDIEEFAASVPTKVNNRSLKKIIADERRFVLFNSRRLSGECLPICAEAASTKNPTDPPSMLEANVGPPTDDPTDALTANPTTNPPSMALMGVGTDDPTDAPVATKDPTANPTKEPTTPPTKEPTANPTMDPTADPTKAPTEQPSHRITAPPKTGTPTLGKEVSEGAENCAQFVNLGYGFSAATHDPSIGATSHYGQQSGQCFPAITSIPHNINGFPGRDDSISTLVGGSYYGISAAEVEGNMVVMKNLMVDKNGPGNFVSVGVGSNVIPNNGGECIKVGGQIRSDRDIQVYNQYAAKDMHCDIVYKGSATKISNWKTNGKKRYDPTLDLSDYETMLTVLKKKSQYWKTLKSTGTVDAKYSTTTFSCSNKDEVQVFNIYPNEEKDKLNGGVTSFKFTSDCADQTILINVQGTGTIGVSAVAMYDANNKMGYGEGGFSTCMTSSILWNIPDATKVDIGNGKTSEFHGSLLVGGDLKLSTSGQSGRTMVLGDLYHESTSGSEFHSYEFNPPTPLPFDPNDLSCADFISNNLDELGDNISVGAGAGSYNPKDDGGIIPDGAMEAPETDTPSKKPTEAPKPPKPMGCKKKGNNSNGVSDANCAKCTGAVTWWPCKGTQNCEGAGCVLH